MAAPLGFQLNPTDSDIVKVLNLCASGRHPGWLPVANVYSLHPDVLFGSVKPVAETTKRHIVLGVIMYEELRERSIPGGAKWTQSGHPERVDDEVSGSQIGYFKLFRLYQNGNSTPWVLKEYRSLSVNTEEFPFSVFTVCLRSSAYLRAETLLAKGTKAMAAAPAKLDEQPAATTLRRTSENVILHGDTRSSEELVRSVMVDTASTLMMNALRDRITIGCDLSGVSLVGGGSDGVGLVGGGSDGVGLVGGGSDGVGLVGGGSDGVSLVGGGSDGVSLVGVGGGSDGVSLVGGGFEGVSLVGGGSDGSVWLVVKNLVVLQLLLKVLQCFLYSFCCYAFILCMLSKVNLLKQSVMLL